MQTRLVWFQPDHADEAAATSACREYSNKKIELARDTGLGVLDTDPVAEKEPRTMFLVITEALLENRRCQMENWGALLPAWLLGVPFLLAIVDRLSIGGPRSQLNRSDFGNSPRVP
jgi:hypothetical protein